MFASKDVFLKSSGGGYTIARSVRLRSSASAYISRTPATTTNRRTWTWSAWVKRGALGSVTRLFSADNGVQQTLLRFQADNTIQFQIYNSSVAAQIITTQVFRDPAAWYHIVAVMNTTDATSANRMVLYINGVQVTALSTASYPSQNYDAFVNQTILHSTSSAGSSEFFDGYLTEVNFVDGQALTPSSFGATDAITGVWQPTKYSGTYGTNGFYLKFADNSTAAALGTDSSGNGNTWTVNNISVTAGVTYDSMTDVPTLTSATVANYCVLNPINKGTNQTLTNGNLTANSSGHGTVLTTIGVTSGLWYAESTLTATGPGGIGFTSNPAAESSYTTIAGKWWCYDNGTNFLISNQASSTSYATRFASGQVWQWAINVDTGNAWIGVNNVWLNSTNGTNGDPATGANPTFTFTAGTLIWPFLEGAGNPTWNANFGQRPFTYTPPSGFVALNTYNLSTPTIPNGAAYMAATTYTGTGAALTVANTVNGTNFQPDWVWVKGRSGATDHALYDVLRGTTKQLESNNTAAETTEATGLTAFGSTGFTVGALAQMNTSAATYVAWQWKANGAGVTNTNGSITSTVSANTTAGFAVVTYTGTGAAATVGHGLGVVPNMIIVKGRSTAGDPWAVYHSSLANTQYLYLNTTAAVATGVNLWNSTTPTSSVFSIGASQDTNRSAGTLVAYVFAAIAGYSAFGSYTGNGSADGPFVFLGFRPRFIFIKSSSRVEDWHIMDTSRSTYNKIDADLYPNLSNAEAANNGTDILSNGFKLRSTDSGTNFSGATYIYMAFAENPFKYSLAR